MSSPRASSRGWAARKSSVINACCLFQTVARTAHVQAFSISMIIIGPYDRLNDPVDLAQFLLVDVLSQREHGPSAG